MVVRVEGAALAGRPGRAHGGSREGGPSDSSLLKGAGGGGVRTHRMLPVQDVHAGCIPNFISHFVGSSDGMRNGRQRVLSRARGHRGPGSRRSQRLQDAACAGAPIKSDLFAVISSEGCGITRFFFRRGS